jgi:hypothetical protein
MSARPPVNIEKLTAALAVRVMGWGVGADRFPLGQRRWMPRWRFQPEKRIEDAFRLLERLVPDECDMSAAPNGDFRVKLRVGKVEGEATEDSKARAITFCSGSRSRP